MMTLVKILKAVCLGDWAVVALQSINFRCPITVANREPDDDLCKNSISGLPVRYLNYTFRDRAGQVTRVPAILELE